MIEFGDDIYYIDIKALDAAITPDKNWDKEKITEVEKKTHLDSKGEILSVEVIERIYNKGKEIDGAKYETIRMCLEILIDYDEETDDTLGVDRVLEKTPLSYKLAFNTLVKEGILKIKPQS